MEISINRNTILEKFVKCHLLDVTKCWYHYNVLFWHGSCKAHEMLTMGTVLVEHIKKRGNEKRK